MRTQSSYTNRLARQVIFAYAIFSSLWILLPDQVLNPLIKNEAFKALLQTIKFWAFIPAACGLLYILVRRGNQAQGMDVVGTRQCCQT
ncbi:MAG: hypothetical protein JO235_06685 [Chroococcidiopsidaceae cyanobacterium CP_BM_RX_35]|nr:hypothetical protein [Chroococcidiopsidaceae cyanobacterium CP_BM_RX_35]